MKSLLIEAKNEIVALRRHNELLGAQMAIVDVFAAALGLRHGGEGASPDVAWALQKKIDELNLLDSKDSNGVAEVVIGT